MMTCCHFGWDILCGFVRFRYLNGYFVSYDIVLCVTGTGLCLLAYYLDVVVFAPVCVLSLVCVVCISWLIVLPGTVYACLLYAFCEYVCV